MNKKGFFFTTIGIIFALVLLIAFDVFNDKDVIKYSDTQEIRVITINDFVKDVEQDIQKGIIITTSRTFLAIQEYLTEQGAFLDDIDSRFEQAFLNGTLETTQLDLLENSTFPDWVGSISGEAQTIDVQINFTVHDVWLVQPSPWDINITVNVTINATDLRNTASWYDTRLISSQINIVEFEDPLYLVNTLGKVTNIIYPTNYTTFVEAPDTTNLGIHANNSFYVATNLSPSYLMRMEGDLSPSPVGIESLINLKKLQDQGIAIDVRSVVDHIYWSNSSPTLYRINNTPSWFYLDEGHLETYQATNATL